MKLRHAVLAILLTASLPLPLAAQESNERVNELERKVDVLTQELANLKLGQGSAAMDTSPMRARYGLAPAAAKVYGGHGVSIGGYGEMLFEKGDRKREDGAPSGGTDRIDFLRQILYVGYKFDDRLLFNSEIEIEHAGVFDEAEVEVDTGTGEGTAELTGEVVLEFAYIDLMLRPQFGLRAGMLLVPLGLTNEMHEPPVFLGARRPDVERNVIPTTWRANGAGVYGEFANGLSYRAYVIEGLDGAHFSASSTVRSGRQNGSRSTILKPAFAARLDWAGNQGLQLGVSAFTGTAWQAAQPAGVNLDPRVTLCDIHARWQWRGLESRALLVAGTLDDASDLSDVLGLAGSERLGEKFTGGYIEAGYDVLQTLAPGSRYRMTPYVRYETYDTQNDVPGGLENPANEHRVITAGAAFAPHPQVVLKIDREQRHNEAETDVNRWNAALGYLF